jgi:hypothetical protein
MEKMISKPIQAKHIQKWKQQQTTTNGENDIQANSGLTHLEMETTTDNHQWRKWYPSQFRPNTSRNGNNNRQPPMEKMVSKPIQAYTHQQKKKALIIIITGLL